MDEFKKLSDFLGTQLEKLNSIKMKTKTIFDFADEIMEECQSGTSQSNIIQMIEDYHKQNVHIRVHGEQGNENAFLEAAKPMMKYLSENYHPHVTVIIDGSRAELLEGLKTVGCDDYIRD